MTWRAGGDGHGISVPAEHWERIFGTKPKAVAKLVPAEPDLITTPEVQERYAQVLERNGMPYTAASTRRLYTDNELNSIDPRLAVVRVCPGCDLHEGPQPLSIHPE